MVDRAKPVESMTSFRRMILMNGLLVFVQRMGKVGI